MKDISMPLDLAQRAPPSAASQPASTQPVQRVQPGRAQADSSQPATTQTFSAQAVRLCQQLGVAPNDVLSDTPLLDQQGRTSSWRDRPQAISSRAKAESQAASQHGAEARQLQQLQAGQLTGEEAAACLVRLDPQLPADVERDPEPPLLPHQQAISDIQRQQVLARQVSAQLQQQAATLQMQKDPLSVPRMLLAVQSQLALLTEAVLQVQRTQEQHTHQLVQAQRGRSVLVAGQHHIHVDVADMARMQNQLAQQQLVHLDAGRRAAQLTLSFVERGSDKQRISLDETSLNVRSLPEQGDQREQRRHQPPATLPARQLDSGGQSSKHSRRVARQRQAVQKAGLHLEAEEGQQKAEPSTDEPADGAAATVTLTVAVTSAKQPAQVVVPFCVAASWIIPNIKVPAGGASQQQWVAWNGRQLSDVSLQQILEDWDSGLLNRSTRAAIAPLRILEHPALRRVWRFASSNVLKAVMHWKTAVYAMHRRVAGGARHRHDERRHAAMSLADAVSDVLSIMAEDSAEQGGSAGSKAANQPTMSKLVRDLLPRREWQVAEYEEQVLRGDSFFLLPSSRWHEWAPPADAAAVLGAGCKAAARMNAKKARRVHDA